MYLSDLIREPINELLEKTFVGKSVTFSDENYSEVTIICAKCELGDDDGNVWLKFTDTEGNTYYTEGQGIDIWFEIKENEKRELVN